MLRAERNRRQHLSSVLSRNEVDRDYAWNRALFKRLRQGWYQLNPALAVRIRVGTEECWRPALAVLNLLLIGEATPDLHWPWVQDLAQLAGLPVPSIPVAAERAVARRRAEQLEREKAEAEALAEARRLAEQRAATRAAAGASTPPGAARPPLPVRRIPA